ncbi:hypothetical protein B0I08_103154 [Glaciihabitans tibetensis]|uniref:3-hydroxyacyl-CoA dehydrogenase n=1 Tax=Glaciihabitans tibetensis TaxID=1266600 RepID=A0A2T0VFG6_9MICO|nr:Rv3235 family protein [Glaciihabitans tibetensis]PRY68949.1 hypothetical protein B0I08_103154 [Glaciihabitans tibetensis]
MPTLLNAAQSETAESVIPIRSRASSPERAPRSPFEADDFFDFQPSLREELPDPAPLLENLAKSAFEIIAGARDLDQIARWVTDPVYRDLLRRVILGTRVRRRNNAPVPRPRVSVMSMTMFEPRDGVIEATILLNTHPRVRAVAIRLEGLDKRWRASVLAVL